jgi:exopolyphosphatase/guanosine-5'-triphosphate,3'-diphosphate pyrophosphatase
MKNKLILDVGTNSIKYFHFLLQNRKWELINKGKIENRLGDGIDGQGLISRYAIDSCINTIKQILLSVKYDNCACKAFGTEVFRAAKNANEVIETIKRETSIEIQILTQKQELEIYWKGLIRDFDYDGIIAAIDIGGGSVQFMYGNKKGLQGCHYLKTGALFLRNQFIKSEPPTVEEYSQIENYIREQIKNITIQFPPETPYIHGSTSVIDFYTEAKLNLVPNSYSITHPYMLDMKDTHAFYNKLRILPREERVKYFPSEPGFTDGASIGMANVLLIAEKTGLTYEVPSNNSIINGFL